MPYKDPQKNAASKRAWADKNRVSIRERARENYATRRTDAEFMDKNRASAASYRARNNDKSKASVAAWKKANPEKHASLNRKSWKRRYGLSVEQLENIFVAQDGGCAICKIPLVGLNKAHVDHDHTCCPTKCRACGDCVRGLLCFQCNTGLGMFKDNAELLKNAMDYLAKPRGT